MATSNRVLRACLKAAFLQSIDHLENLDRRSVAATASLDTLRQRLSKTLADDGIAPDQVIKELVEDVDGGIVGSASGRYFAGVIGGALPAALAADWLASAWDQNAVLYVVRFLDPRPGTTEQDHDRRTDEVVEAICATGEAVFGGTTWRGRRAKRVSVCNWRTSDEDVERVIKAVAGVLGGSAIAALRHTNNLTQSTI